MRTAKTTPLLLLILTLVGCGDNEQVTTASTTTTSATEIECVPRDVAPDMPATATAYADLCSRLLGEIPTADCGEGVRIPIYVDGEEVFETPADGASSERAATTATMRPFKTLLLLPLPLPRPL